MTPTTDIYRALGAKVADAYRATYDRWEQDGGPSPSHKDLAITAAEIIFNDAPATLDSRYVTDPAWAETVLDGLAEDLALDAEGGATLDALAQTAVDQLTAEGDFCARCGQYDEDCRCYGPTPGAADGRPTL